MSFRLNPAQRRSAVWMLLASALCFSAASAAADRYRIAYDGQDTRCLPWSWYLIDLKPSGEIHSGMLVAYVSEGIRGFADGTRLLKRVRGVPGDAIAVRAGEVAINGEAVDRLRPEAMTRLGKVAADFERAYTLAGNQYFVMGETPSSYDSRYTGPIERRQVMGVARGLW